LAPHLLNKWRAWRDGRPYYPALAAVYPVVSIAAANAFDVSIGEVAILSAAFAVLGLLVHIAVLGAVPRRVSPGAASLTSLVVIAWLFDAVLVADRGVLIGVRSLLAMIAISIVAAGLVVWLQRSNRPFRRLTQAARTFTVVLLGWSAVTLVTRRLSTQHAVARSTFVRDLTKPLPQPVRAPLPGRRNVYLLVLDGYANAAVLAHSYGFDNSAFLDSLRGLGFTVARESRSNYGWTPQSLASVLNVEHIRAMEGDPEARDAPWDVLYTVVRRSRVLSAFSRAGYAVYLVPSASFAGTRYSEVGTSYLPTRSRSLAARLARYPLFDATWRMTLPGRLLDKTHWNLAFASVALAPFEGMRELAPIRGPKLVLAHSLITHQPYFFEADCRLRHLRSGDERAYPDQVRCTNREVLRTVREIVRVDSAPVILIFADHGSESRGLPIDKPAEAFDGERARERFGAFRAQLVPPEIVIADSSTHVNVMRQIVGGMLGIDLPMLADSSYWSSFSPVYHFVAVDSMLRPTNYGGRR
jgi:hypothetical protein